ncbi:MAG: hypothetical protein KDA71_21505, partial [Planctomycetales bacterium]|nr:hypothetical protein [Planctomycetales bacterium]
MAGGRGSENSVTIDEGQDGRILIGDNDDSNELQNTQTDINSAAVQEIAGPKAVNPFLHGDLGLGQATPYIPNLIGGSQIYGFLDGASIDHIDFNPQSADRDAPASNSLVAVMRLPDGLAEIGLGSHPSAINFPGYDWIVVVNLTSFNLAIPRIGIGVHSSGATMQATLSQLAFDDIDLSTPGPVTLTALNAGQVWVTLIPNGGQTQTVRVNASIAGDDSAGGALTNLEAVELGSSGENQVAYITANAPVLQSVGIATASESFSGFKEIVTGVAGEIYALSATRDALVVMDGTDFRVLQVIENNFDGVGNFENVSDLSASQDGQFVRVRSGVDGVVTLARDAVTGDLAFLQSERLDAGETPFSEAVDATLMDLVFDDVNGTAVAHFALQNRVFGQTVERLKLYTVDPTTGVLTAVPDVPDAQNSHEGEIDLPVGGTFVGISYGGGFVYALSELAGDYVLRGLSATSVGFASGGPIESDDVAFGFRGADHLMATNDFVHLLSESGNFVTTLEQNGIGFDFIQKVQNGARGVTGLIAPVALAESADASFAFVTGRDADNVVVIRLDGSGAMAQRLRNNSAGITGLVAPVSITRGTSGGSIVVATLGDGNTRGGLVSLDSLSELGNATVLRSGDLLTVDQMFVLPDSFGETESVITSWRFAPQESSVADAFPAKAIPLILERDVATDTWTITGVGRTRVIDAGFGEEQRFDFDLQSGSPITTGRYFGWYSTGVDPGQPQPLRGTIDYDTGAGSTTFALDLSTGSFVVDCQ